MPKLLFLLFVYFLFSCSLFEKNEEEECNELDLLACSLFSEDKGEECKAKLKSCGSGNIPNYPYGWQGTELTREKRGEEISLSQITHYDSLIFVRSGEINTSLPMLNEKIRKLYSEIKIFYSKQGSEVWDTLKLPDGSNPNRMLADSNGLYVGALGTGKLWKYNPISKEWKDMGLPELREKQWLMVYGITKFEGNVFVDVVGYNDSADYSTDVFYNYLQQPDGTWKEISPGVRFLEAKEWRGNLFAQLSIAGGGNGNVWRFSPNHEWSKIPNVVHSVLEDFGELLPNGAAEVFDDKLFVGFTMGVFSLNDDYSSWSGMDSTLIYIYMPNGRGGSNLIMKIDHWKTSYNFYPEEYGFFDYCDPAEYGFTRENAYLGTTNSIVCNSKHPVFLASDGKNLFASGSSGAPHLYMGNRGEPKGWRKISGDTWCPQFSDRECVGTSVWGLDVVGDTLYAAGEKGLLKLPLAHLDSAVANVPSYP